MVIASRLGHLRSMRVYVCVCVWMKYLFTHFCHILHLPSSFMCVGMLVRVHQCVPLQQGVRVSWR